MNDDVRITLAGMQERVGAIDKAVTASHSRIDKLDQEIKESLKEMSLDLKIVVAHMNRSKGWGAAAMLGATIIGGILGALIKFLIH